jgi:methylated-DNA-[protein]-cysteine S-methyltransferase
MNLYHDTFATPFGTFSVAVDDSGALHGTAFGDASSLNLRGKRPGPRDRVRTAEARRQVLDYLRGRRRAFDLRLAEGGTPFQESVWAAIRAIPYGKTATYAGIAKAVGRPRAVRAVGGASGANPVCVVTPCHRVVGSDGSLTGFAFGEDLKRRLLSLEAGG